MAADILIVPNKNSSTLNPNIQFSGSAVNTIKLEAQQSGSVAFVGNSGSLFSVVDSLSGSLMAVSDVSGLPVLEVFSDDRVVMGKYASNALIVTGSLVAVGKATPLANLDVNGTVLVTGSVKLPTVYSGTSGQGANVYIDSAGLLYRSIVGATSGTSGTNGSSGTSGTNGSSGTSGTNGSSGTSGTNGSSGTSGTNGSSGTSGTTPSISGTDGTIAKFGASNSLGNSAITQAGNDITVTGVINQNSTGNNTFKGVLMVGHGLSSSTDAAIEVGIGRTISGNAYLDLTSDSATYTDYGLRLIRNGTNSPNGNSDIVHRGTGDFNIYSSEDGKIVIRANQYSGIVVKYNATELTGRVGIGTEPSYPFDVLYKSRFSNSIGVGTPPSGTAGEIRASGDISAYYSSDERLKTNIVKIDDALKKLMQIDGVLYDWSDEFKKNHGGEDGYFIRNRNPGVIAQQVEKAFPNVVADRQDGYKAVRYELLVPLIIESIKDQQKQIEYLKSELAILQK